MASLNASQITGRGWSALMSAMLRRLGQVTRSGAPQRWRGQANNQAGFHAAAAAPPSERKRCGGVTPGGVRGIVAAEMQVEYRSLHPAMHITLPNHRQA